MSATATTLYDIPVTTIAGEPTTLEAYRGKVLLIVNVASQCGFTGQYAGLDQLYREYKDRGLVVLGFPCNQFMGQEPGTNADVQEFCSVKFHVTFPMFEKVDVNGSNAHPLYRWLKAAAPGTLGTQSVKWNFTKFLVNRDGTTVTRFGTAKKPAALAKYIERLL